MNRRLLGGTTRGRGRRVVRVGRDHSRVLRAEPVDQLVNRTVLPHTGRRRHRGLGRLRRRRWGHRRLGRLRRSGVLRRSRRLRVGDHRRLGLLRLRGRGRSDLLRYLTRHVLRTLVLGVEAQDERALLGGLRGEGQSEEGLVLLLVRGRHLVCTRQRVRDQRARRPVDRRVVTTLDPLVIEAQQKGVDHRGVLLVFRRHVDDGVARLVLDDLAVLVDLVRQPHLHTRLLSLLHEGIQPGVGLLDGEVADLGCAQRLGVCVTHGGVRADLGHVLGEDSGRGLRLVGRRVAVAVEATALADELQRVPVEDIAASALRVRRQQLTGLDGQIDRRVTVVRLVRLLLVAGGREDVPAIGPSRGRVGRTDCEQCCHRHGQCCQERRQGGPLHRFEHREDRGDDGEDEHPNGCSETQPDQEASAQDERDPPDALAADEGADEGADDHRDEQARPVDADCDRQATHPEDDDEDDCEQGDAHQEQVPGTSQSAGQQDQAQDDADDVNHLGSFLWSCGSAPRFVKFLPCIAEAAVAAARPAGAGTVDQSVERSVVRRGRQQAGSLAGGAESHEVVPRPCHFADVLGHADTVGVGSRASCVQFLAELSELVVTVVCVCVHQVDSGVEPLFPVEAGVVQGVNDSPVEGLVGHGTPPSEF